MAGSKAFLDHFEDLKRSGVTNLFLSAVRSGAQTVPGVLIAVDADLDRVLAIARQNRDARRLLIAAEIAAALIDHVEDARAFAQHCLDWEALPPAERAALKDQRAAEGRRQWMATQPATEKQIAYLRSLGYAGAVESKAHASDLIERYKRKGTA